MTNGIFPPPPSSVAASSTTADGMMMSFRGKTREEGTVGPGTVASKQAKQSVVCRSGVCLPPPDQAFFGVQDVCK